MYIFIIGDLTEGGYHRKLSRLEALPSTSSEGVHVHEATTSRQITQDLSKPNENVKEKIKELFGRRHSSLPKRETKPKKCVSKPLPIHRKKVTVVCVDDKTFSIPTRKARDKLVEECKIKELYIGKAETKSAIVDKINKLFPASTQFVFLKTTGGKDLIPATFSDYDDDIQGDAILELADANNLYVRATQPAQHSSDAGVTPPSAGLPPPPVQHTQSAQQSSNAHFTPTSAGLPPPPVQRTPSAQHSSRQADAGFTPTSAGLPPPPVQHSARPPPPSLPIQQNTVQATGSIRQIAGNGAGQQFLVGAVGQVYATVVPTPKQFNKGI